MSVACHCAPQRRCGNHAPTARTHPGQETRPGPRNFVRNVNRVFRADGDVLLCSTRPGPWPCFVRKGPHRRHLSHERSPSLKKCMSFHRRHRKVFQLLRTSRHCARPQSSTEASARVAKSGCGRCARSRSIICAAPLGRDAECASCWLYFPSCFRNRITSRPSSARTRRFSAEWLLPAPALSALHSPSRRSWCSVPVRRGAASVALTGR